VFVTSDTADRPGEMEILLLLPRGANVIFWTVSIVAFAIVVILCQRQRTKWRLERCGLPTVFWRPWFMSYRLLEEDQKLASTTITRILPRMERLQGPFGMYGTVYGISTPVVHVAHPIPAKAILNGMIPISLASSNTSTCKYSRRCSIPLKCKTGASKAPAYNHFKNFCGEGVFTADGDDWRAKRTAVMHTLLKGTDLSRRLEQEANHAANTFCRQIQTLQSHRNSCSSNDSEVLVPNVVPLLQRATVGLIYRYITNNDPDWELRNAVKSGYRDSSNGVNGVHAKSVSLASCSVEKDFNSSLRNENESLLSSYLKSVTRIRLIILAQSRSIWFILPWWCYRWFSSLYRDEEKTLGPIRKFAQQACDQAKPNSPLHNLSTIEGPYNLSSQNHDRHCTTLGKKNLLNEAITLLFAGQDTSAATLSWTLHLLSLYPKIQEKLALEVHRVFSEDLGYNGTNDSDSLTVSKRTISRMPYLDAVIKESMRLYPVAPFIVRRLTETIHLPGSKGTNAHISIPSGSVACIWIYSLHRNPDFWHRPDEFVPDRWLDADLKDLGQSNGAYMPFASGPRNCLGQPLAHFILRTLLSKMVYQYEFRDPALANVDNADELRKDMQVGFTVLPTGGVELLVRTRHKKKES
jgi:cytochrome P450